jgi:DNA-directed RNA polymerase specialized sigma24 family protein
VAILRRHGGRWPREDDFVSLVAAEMADRLHGLTAGPLPPFLTMLDRVAGAVRHRIARAARRRITHPPTEALNQIPSPEVGSRSVAEELATELSLEEQTVLTLFLEGVPVEQVARKLNVSMRTVYRRLAEIKRRLSEDGAS